MSATRFFTRWDDGTKIFALNPKLEKQNFSLLRRYGSESNFWVGPYYSFCPGILELKLTLMEHIPSPRFQDIFHCLEPVLASCVAEKAEKTGDSSAFEDSFSDAPSGSTTAERGI